MAGNSVLAKLSVLISAQTAEFGKALNQTQRELNGFTKNIEGLAKTVGIAFGVREVASFAFEISKLAGEAEGVEAAFSRLPNSEKVMKELKEATHDTVSELDLMKRTVQATNFGISLEALPKLLEFASLRAQQTGQSVDYLVDSIVTGIGRKSPLILDNLGISAVQLKKQLNGVSVEAASIGDVADAVGRIATESLGSMGEYSDNTATKVQQLNAQWENFKVRMGEAANESGVLKAALEELGDALDGIGGVSRREIEALSSQLAVMVSQGNKGDGLVQSLKEMRVEVGKPLEINVNELIEKYKLTGEQADILTNKILEINGTLSDQERRIKIFKDFAKGYEDVNKAAEDFKNIQYQNILQQRIVQADLEKYTPELKEEIKQTEVKIKVYKDLIATVNEYIKANAQIVQPQTEQLGLLESLQEKLKTFEEQRKKAFDANSIATFNDQIRKTQEQIDLLLAGTNNLSSFGKQQETNAAAGKPTEFKDLSAGSIGSQDGGDKSAFAMPDITAQTDAYIVNIDRAKLSLQDWGTQMQILGDTQEAQFQRSMDAALSYGDAIGQAIGTSISESENATQALKRLTNTIVQQFLRQALGAIIASASKSGGPPPVAIALAAAGVAAISAMFSKIGASGGGGGSKSLGGSASRSVTNAERYTAARDGNRVELAGNIVWNGRELQLALENANNRSSRLG